MAIVMNDTLNLDTMTTDELWRFWQYHKHGMHYKRFYPNGGRGSKITTRSLANYAANKATAQELRLEGDVISALKYENICQRIYESLPHEVRW